MVAEVDARYRHYKNGEVYRVVSIALNSETLEEMVVYQGEYVSDEFGKNPLWVRPRGMFEEQVIYNGVEMQRFSPVE